MNTFGNRNSTETIWDLRQYKPTNLTYQQQYVSLYNIRSLDEAITNGRLDQIMLLYNQGLLPTVVQLNILVADGNFEILNYYANQNILPNFTAYYYAAINNIFDILEWLYQKDIEFPGEVEVDGITYSLTAAIIKSNGLSSLPALLWFEKYGLPIDEWTANQAALLGNIQLLEWLASLDILPDEEGIRQATDLKTLIWLSQYYKPTAGWALTTIHRGNTKILEWLSTQGIGYNEIVAWVKANYINNRVINQWLADNKPGNSGRIY